ncbi:hypothetical protein M8998_01625 [Sphingobacterium sp. lm-10]|uniref:hypothetical protein n=1 Tax=Sphingobacterium sp. lm-10 TaxID=2944904 RepID=UPI002021FD5D|nr:hypothetical protein [Sphingobacterium sp. lm-10]MCL7986630.1 hypothetical protein [Sphingobacterium sp. lm-10]
MSDTKLSPVWPGPCVLVPMATDVLLIGNIDYQSKTKWSSLKDNYYNLYMLQSPDQPAPFGEKKCPEPGVHLMWTLPYSMRKGSQNNETHEVTFPNAPNRWLVTRFEYPRAINDTIPDGTPIKVSPVVQDNGVNIVMSDALYPIEDAPGNYNQYPYPEDTEGLPVRGIGKTFILKDWTGEATAGKSFLQAVGPGDVSWSVAYDNITNVFSLHDTPDPSNAIFTYSIIGWYANLDDDILTDLPVNNEEIWETAIREKYLWTVGDGTADVEDAIHAWLDWQKAHGLVGDFDPSQINLPEQAKNAIIAWYNWQQSHGDKAAPLSLPTQTICHSMVANVIWEGYDTSYGSGAPGGGTQFPDVAIGSNAIEAISAYMANKVAKEYKQESFVFEIERALEAFQRDLIFDLDNDPVNVETQLHNSRFETTYAGQEWIVVNAEQGENNKAETGGQQTVHLDETQTKFLIALNTLQSEVNDLYRLIISQRTELFALSLKKNYAGRRVPNLVKESLQAISTNLNANIDGYKTKQEQATNDAKAYQDSLGSEYVVKAVDLVAFAAPNDPVIMVAGIGQDTKLSDPTEYQDGSFLRVRVTGQTVSAIDISYKVSDSVQTQNIGAAEILHAVSMPSWNVIPKEVMDLWVESLLMDQSCARLLATIFFNKCGVIKPDNSQINPLAEQVRKQQTVVWNDPRTFECHVQTLADVAKFTGVIPSEIGVAYRIKQPWSPVYMDWKIRWLPTSLDDTKELLEWRLGDIDYEWQGSEITPIQNFPPFMGRAILNAETSKLIQGKFETFTADSNYDTSNIPYYIKEDLKIVAKEIAKIDILTQAMNGLTKQLTTSFIAMNTYPTDADVVDLLGDSNYNFRPVTGSMNAASPQPFFPIPAGHFEVLDIWVVDAFGQILQGGQQSPIPDVNWSESLTTISPAYHGATKNFGQLPPRLAQPAKVNLQLLQNDDDNIKSNSSDLTSPICGWVMPNHLDNSLIVFNAEGENMGAVIKVGHEGDSGDRTASFTIRWDAVPGSDAALGAPPEFFNKHLQAFIIRLLATAPNGSGAYDDFMASIDDSLWTMSNLGNQNGNLSILLGRPLALVRGEIAMALSGMPAFNQSWMETGKYYNQSGTYKLELPDFCQVPFTVRVGDSHAESNGVLGYFQEDNYDTFYSVYGANGQTVRINEAFSKANNLQTKISDLIDDGREVRYKTNYVKAKHVVQLAANEKPVKLTLLIDPSGNIPVISGSLPSLTINLPNGPVATALNNLKATFRAGPLLLDPLKIKMPTPAEVKGKWSWMARKDVTTWNEEVAISSSTPVATLHTTPPSLIEGWIVLSGSHATDN